MLEGLGPGATCICCNGARLSKAAPLVLLIELLKPAPNWWEEMEGITWLNIPPAAPPARPELEKAPITVCPFTSLGAPPAGDWTPKSECSTEAPPRGN